MSRRVRVNVIRLVCRLLGHDQAAFLSIPYCTRCGRLL